MPVNLLYQRKSCVSLGNDDFCNILGDSLQFEKEEWIEKVQAVSGNLNFINFVLFKDFAAGTALT